MLEQKKKRIVRTQQHLGVVQGRIHQIKLILVQQVENHQINKMQLRRGVAKSLVVAAAVTATVTATVAAVAVAVAAVAVTAAASVAMPSPTARSLPSASCQD